MISIVMNEHMVGGKIYMLNNFIEDAKSFIDAVEKPVLIVDSQFRVIAVNSFCCRNFKRESEVIGKKWEIDRKHEYTSLPLRNSENKEEYACLIQEGKVRKENIDETTGIQNYYGLTKFYKNIQGDFCYDYIFLEIENYFFVKDIYGKPKGKEYLVRAWRKIETVFQDERDIFFSRQTGGQFLIVIRSDKMSEEKLEEYLKRIFDELQKGVRCEEMTIETPVAVGILRNQKVFENLDDILHKCRLALRKAKEKGYNRYVFYNHIEGQMRENKELEAIMADDLADGRFVPYLQPKMNALANTICGAEALVRWNNEKRGMIPPGKFIPLMEQNGFVQEIDFSILEQVCQMKKRWWEEDKSYKNLIISVNMSRVHFFDKNFVNKLLHIVDQYGIPRHEIDLEITEGVFFEDATVIKDTIAKLRGHGFVISIDDFGSSYSSLGMLKDVKADILKLDKTFIDTSGAGDKAAAVIRNVISMGTDLKMKVISEGVETEEEKKLVTGFGCEIIQGYFYSRPLPVKEFESFAEKYSGENFLNVHFPLRKNVVDDTNSIKGEIIGDDVAFQDNAIVFPGGEEMKNVVVLPTELMISDSYTISMWLCVREYNRWSSAFFVRYQKGFLSFAPYIREGTSIFRICDDRKQDGWNDIFYDAVPLNEWMHVVLTLDSFSETSRLYINGEMIQFIEHVPTLNGVEKVVLGGDYYQRSFQGKIKNLRIIGRAQASEKVREIYEKERKDVLQTV